MDKLEFFNKDKKSVGYLEIENINANAAHLNIYGDIVGSDVYKESDLDIAPSDVLNLLKNIKNKDLTVNINSPGGSVFAGIGIYNAIKQSCKGKIIVNITGIAGSISSVIAMCGDTINMPMNTHMMIHKPSLSISGDADDLINASALLNKVQDIILNTYMLNAAIAISRTYIKDLMDKETYLAADDCSKLFKNVVVLQKGFTNKCKDSKGDDSEDKENKCDEKDKCNPDKTKDLDEKKKIEEDKCKSVDNFNKELSIFLCKNL